MGATSVEIRKAQAERTKCFHLAAADLTARLVERKDRPTPSALHIFLEGDDYKTEYGFYASESTRTLAGVKALEALQDGIETWFDVSIMLAARLSERSHDFFDTYGHVFVEDIDEAIEILETLLARESLAKVWKIAAHKEISAAWEKRWEYTRNELELTSAISHTEELANAVEKGEAAECGAIATCLRFKMDPSAISCILEIPMVQLRTQAVAFSKVAAQKYRFIDARSLAAGHILRVVEFSALPKKRYCALSYIWRGYSVQNAPQSVESSTLGTLNIKGASNADPVSMDVLITVCRCVMARKCELLWIDGICIVQDDEEDKSWQIKNMFNIYKHCMQCIILPGGLSRLVPLTESTPWIHRAWTLQEALVPDHSICLFSWTHGNGNLQAHFWVPITVIEPGRSASCDLRGLLEAHVRRTMTFVSSEGGKADPILDVPIRICGNEQVYVATLVGAFEGRGTSRGDHAIWRSSLTRVATRAADAVFSIMGLFGVVLEPRDFDPDDRTTATIALMREILGQGKCVEWLGVAHSMPINKYIPSLPAFPEPGPGGLAMLKINGSEVPIPEAMRDTWWRLDGAPVGSMDANGSLNMSAPMIPVRRSRQSESDVEVGPDNDFWGWNVSENILYFSPTSSGSPHALLVGEKKNYVCGVMPAFVRSKPWLIMVARARLNHPCET